MTVSMLSKPTRKQQRWAFENFVADDRDQKLNSTAEEIAKAWQDLTPFDRIKYDVVAVCDRDTSRDDIPLPQKPPPKFFIRPQTAIPRPHCEVAMGERH